MRTFEVGKTYSCRSICDHNCIWTFTVKSRTAKTVTLIDDSGKEMTRRLITKASVAWGAEVLYPFGNYSMCPVLSA